MSAALGLVVPSFVACARPAVVASAAKEPAPAGGPWTSALRTGHPLVGRIWSPAGARFVDRAELEGSLAAARFVLLGEQHDNPDHHRLQRELLGALVARGRKPAVVFEMVDVDDQAKLDAARASAPKDADALGEAVSWGARGWSWPLYRPIVAEALDAGLPIVAGNFPIARVKALFAPSNEGAPQPPTDEEKRRLGVDVPLPESETRALEEELVAAHCGHPVGPMLPAFVLAQRLRDAQMAERMATIATSDGAVLIAGTGHARRDRGVPVYLPFAERAFAEGAAAEGPAAEGAAAAGARDAKGASIRSVAFVEVRDGMNAPEAYAEAFHAKALPFDAVWFTPAFDDTDPCAPK